MVLGSSGEGRAPERGGQGWLGESRHAFLLCTLTDGHTGIGYILVDSLGFLTRKFKDAAAQP